MLLVRKGQLGRMALMVLQDRKGQPDLPEQTVLMELLDHRVPLGLLDRKVPLVP